MFNSLILQNASLDFSNHRLEKLNLPWTTFNEIILHHSQVVRKVHFIHSFRIFRLPHASGLKWLGEVKKSMKLSLVPLMRLGGFRNYPSTYVLTHLHSLKKYKPRVLGSQLIVSLVDIFGTKINQIKQQC